ncbi:MAG: hypothetical protein K2J67_04600 [Lachnospiraceae bacterium]|nr:hypothetical protein [Lachnospiraceae bacterium]
MILEKVNEERQRQSARTKKDCAKAEKELQNYEKRRKKIFEAYEDGIINGEEFLKQKSEIAEEIEQLQKKIKNLTLLEGQESDFPFDVAEIRGSRLYDTYP